MTVVRFVEASGHGLAGERERGFTRTRGTASLTDVETARRDRLVHAEDRAAYEAAHLLARDVAGELLGRDPGALVLAQRCEGCGSDEHGVPRIVGAPDDVHVSLSHARGVVAAIAARRPCGVDVERMPGAVPAGALTPAERAWLEGEAQPARAALALWTRKECLVKAGLATLDRVHAVDARRAPDGVRFGEWQGRSALGSWCVVDESGGMSGF
ncbi:4'-phosphopantetheinyl transferase family protein [Microbacterium sp. No. 7]|uniref:4'-phosphopantetheinyl transferase family protein n=1 Tax=Microbacterium sp. No. 7 TaxID=1714373 RepID=UPI0006D0C136|nr:4'-phosphopantetheinyl transferase superfamily protein [Microbacterium sp. No. 7]